MTLRDEILEQPESMQQLLDKQSDHIPQIADEILSANVHTIFLAARGTSDHAGLYAKYLLGMHNRIPIALAAPSMFSIYKKPPNLEGCCVIAISQSGQSPDIISVVQEGQKQGALTLAITNEPSSPLAKASDLVIDISAGPEYAVAATKTYTADLLAIAMLSQALNRQSFAPLMHVPLWAKEVLRLEESIRKSAQRYRYMTQCVVIGRGYNYATAYEWALKLKELTYAVAAPYSSADFQHGPIAMVSQGFPVFAIASSGDVFSDQLALLTRLKREYRVELFIISDQEAALTLADTAFPVPANIPEWLSPLVNIIPAQLFCYSLTKAKGFDTEAPASLQKVTKTI